MRHLAALLLLLPLTSPAAPVTEKGELNGAPFRIDIPADWNGALLVYCHGYSIAPVTYDDLPADSRLERQTAAFVNAGYAVIQSAYAATGWAVEEAVIDTEALRRLFIRKHGQPKETYVLGHSMGGFLTMLINERFPNAYEGGLALCGPLGPASWFLERRVFDMRVVFDYYLPGALPALTAIPASYEASREEQDRIAGLLAAKPEAAQAVRAFSGIRTDRELAATIVFWTYLLMELEQRAGGNPFDNRDTIYSGTPDDNAVNEGVRRYRADERAAGYVRSYGTPTGRLSRPLLAIHNTYDTLVPPWVTNAYSTLAELTGSSELFVQQYVKTPGHCQITDQEVLDGLRQLRAWRSMSKRPEAGLAGASAN